ncbi:MAG: hypothetical protein FWH25_05015, partial [Syntrophorhabdaceae bacterium]|nr:hypothetical protein [Syntrophorhabdaceae bacterium]
RNCDFGNTEPIMRPLKRCTFLIIDDLGTEDDTESAKSKIHELVKYRHDQMNPTIFTTNLRLEDVRDRYNPRTIDCIFESGLNQIIKIACKSYRQEVGI